MHYIPPSLVYKTGMHRIGDTTRLTNNKTRLFKMYRGCLSRLDLRTEGSVLPFPCSTGGSSAQLEISTGASAGEFIIPRGGEGGGGVSEQSGFAPSLSGSAMSVVVPPLVKSSTVLSESLLLTLERS